MLQRIVMPKLGDTMEEGTVVSWTVAVGEPVKKGDTIMSVETDKATLEVESLVEGTVLKIVVAEGVTAPVGATLGYAGDEGDTAPEEPETAAASTARRTEARPAPAESPPSRASSMRVSSGKLKVSPRAEKLAGELGVDLAKVTGTGPGGRITTRDIESYREEGPQEGKREPEGSLVRLNNRQRITAERMLQSSQTIPAFELMVEVDAGEMMSRLEERKKRGDRPVAIHDILITAAAAALVKHPILTGVWTERGVVVPESFGIGLAVSVEDDLIVPVVQDVGRLSLHEIAAKTEALIEKARFGRIELWDLERACTTISNMGMMGIDAVHPIIVPVQASIIGVGRIRETPIIRDGEMTIAKMMTLAASFDHRFVNGTYAARFLTLVREGIEQPDWMFV